MSVPRRYNKPQNLSRIDVLIEDDAVISRYFNITEFPEVLTQGKSSFLIGGSHLLKLGTEVKFEITNDDSGAVIYTEPVANYLEGTSRRVSIEIYEDNDLFGDCTLTVVGELNPSETNVPAEFRDSYNVRYTRKVYISGAGVNTQPILFYKQPKIHVTEIVKPYISTSVPTGSIMVTGTLTGAPIPEDSGTPTNIETEEEPAKFLKRKKKSLRTKLFGGGGNNSFIRKGRRRVRRSSPEADRYTITKVTGADFDSRMVDGTLRIISASIGGSFQVESYHTTPDVFTTPIEDVKNATTLVPEKPFVITDTRFDSSDPQAQVIVPLAESNNYTIQFQAIPTQSISTVNFRSYADIRLSRLRTFSGDIDRVKVYARNQDAFGDFETISDQQIESPELLFNVFGAGNQSIGFFLEQATINTYWENSVNSTANVSSANLMNALVLSGSNAEYNDKLEYNLKSLYAMTFNDETEYEISFNLLGTKGPKKNITGDTKQQGRLGIFISGSAFTPNHNLGDELGFQLETTSGTPAFLEVDAGIKEDFGNVTEIFQPTFDGYGVLKFVVFSGNFEIADVSIKPASSTGFSPNWIQVIAPVPELTSERPDNYEFIAEFYDVNNNVAETITFASASSFAGGNNYIAGGDNLLSGSVFVGSAIGGGIEMAGVSSGLIRSIGYDGFVSASVYPHSGSSGFMFFSGSVFPNSGDEYRGVGLELFGSTGSYFRYRSDPSILEIVTNTFFVGTSGSGQPEQYVSGSNGNVEISSSDFHLTPTGDVTASAILLGDKGGGQFLQFVDNQLTVQGNLSVDQITTPALIGGVSSTVLNASSSITSDGFAKFTSASIAGWDITTNSISDVNASGKGIVITSDPSTPFIDIKEDASNKIRLYHTAGDDWGIIGSNSGNEIFRLGDTNQIAGWTFNNKRLASWTTSTADKFGISIDSHYQLITFHGDSGAGKNNVGDNDRDNVMLAIGQLTDDVFGIKGWNTAGNRILELSPTRNEIAGWTIGQETLEGGDLILEKNGTIRSRGYQSNTAGSGFILTAASGGFLEVENAKIRGTLSTATFEKESVNAVGGQLYVANSTTLTASVYSPDGNHSNTQRTMSVVNSTGFAVGEIITAKKVSSTGFATEYMLIESASRAGPPGDDTDLSGFLYVQRGYGGGTTGVTGSLGDTPATAQGYSGSQVIVSTGKQGTGYIRLNANPNDHTTPYMDIVERTGAGLYDVELKTRLGDLSGVAGSRNVPLGFTGFGLMSEVAFLSGSMIKLEAPTFLLGDLNQSFVSGSNSFLEISSSRFHLKRDGSMQLGSAGSGITLDSSGNATFNGSITISASDMPDGTVSGSDQIAGITGSLAASSASMAASVRLTSTGVDILNSDSNVISSFSSTATIGLTSGTNNNVFIDSDSVDLRRGTEVTASFGAITTIGPTSGNHVKITADALEIKTSDTITALSASAAGLEMSGTVKANAGLIGGFEIDADEIKAGSTLILDSDSNNGEIKLGAATALNTGDGIYMNGSGHFRAGKAFGEKLEFDGSNLIVSASSFIMGTSGSLGHNGSYISGSSGNIQISSSNFFLKEDGSITAGFTVMKTTPTSSYTSALSTNAVRAKDVQSGDGLFAHWDFDVFEEMSYNDGDNFEDWDDSYNLTAKKQAGDTIEHINAAGAGQDFIIGDAAIRLAGGAHFRSYNTYTGDYQAAGGVSMWFKASSVSSATKQLLYVAGSTSNGFNLYIMSNAIYAAVYIGSGGANDQSLTSLSISASTWYHVCATWDAQTTDTLQIHLREFPTGTYTNASVSLASNIQTANGIGPNFTNNDTNIGAVGIALRIINDNTSSSTSITSGTFTLGFDGWIDDTRWYNKVISADKSLLLFNSAWDEYNIEDIQPAFKLDTTAGKLELNTKEFILGASGSLTTEAFISGSNGALEISSSKFHIKPDGDIIVKKVTADDGTIGGFTIGSNEITLGSTFKLDADTNSGYIAFGGTLNTSAAGTNAGVYMDGTGDFLAAASSTKFIRFEGGNFSIGSDNFKLSTAGNVTMSGDLNAGRGTFQDVNVMGSLVPNANAVGTNDGHKVVETWVNETTTVGGGGTAAIASTLDQLSNSSWGWTATVNSGNASDVNIKFANGDGITGYTVAQMLLTENDDTAYAKGDPPIAFFKSIAAAEGKLYTEGTRSWLTLYDANIYHNHYGNSLGGYKGCAKMGVDLAEASKTYCVITSDAISIPLTQTDIFECFLEFATRDSGNFGGFYNAYQIWILDASDDSILYSDGWIGNGVADWKVVNIPMVSKAGLVTRIGSVQQGEAYTIINSIKIKLQVGGFTTSGVTTYQGGSEYNANYSGGGGSLDGFIITEMRMRRAPYTAALETEQVVISDIYSRAPGNTVTMRGILEATTRLQAPKMGGKDILDTYMDFGTGNLIKGYAGGNKVLEMGSGGVSLSNQDFFLVRPSTDVNNYTDDTDTVIVWGTEIIDQGSNFSSNTFTASRTGAFHLACAIQFQAGSLVSSIHYVIKIVTSNRTYVKMVPGNATELMTMTFSVIADMDAGDTAQIKLKPKGSGTADTDAGSSSTVTSFFCGYMLG